MKVKAKRTVFEDVEVDEKAIIDEVLNSILYKNGLNINKFDEFYFKDGKLVGEEEIHTSHSWYKQTVICDDMEDPRVVLLKAVNLIKTKMDDL